MITDEMVKQSLDIYWQHKHGDAHDHMRAALEAIAPLLIAQARDEFLDCCEYDAMMEGPRFKCFNRSSLERLRKKYEGTRAQELAPTAEAGAARELIKDYLRAVFKVETPKPFADDLIASLSAKGFKIVAQELDPK